MKNKARRGELVCSQGWRRDRQEGNGAPAEAEEGMSETGTMTRKRTITVEAGVAVLVLIVEEVVIEEGIPMNERAGAAHLTVHHLLDVATALREVHLHIGYLLVMQVMTNTAMKKNLHVLKVHHPKVVMTLEVLPHAILLRIDENMQQIKPNQQL